MKRYAGVLLIGNDNSVFLQQRENKSGIVNPGMITTFGGLIEPGENTENAAVREIEEELGYNIEKQALEFLTMIQKNQDQDGEDCDCYIFVLQNVNRNDLHLNEGLAIYIHSEKDDLDMPNFSRVCREALRTYYKGTSSK